MKQAISQSLRSSLLSVLEDNEFVVDLLAELTKSDCVDVRQKLAREHAWPGSAVKEDLREWGLTPYVWSDRLSDFYEQSDAFLYETLVWNRTLMKQQMRQRIVDYLADVSPCPQRAIMFGDGLGIDSLAFSEAGHEVDYFEVSQRCLRFADRLSEPLGRKLSVVSSVSDLTPESYDVAVCLDVLEHVPDPPEVVRLLASLLRPGGLLIVHAPFWYIDHNVSTHLRSNQRYSGELRSLYRGHGLRPVAAQLFWNPIVLEKAIPGAVATSVAVGNQARILTGQLLLTIGRFWRTPHLVVYRWMARKDRRRLAQLAAGL